MKAVSLEALEAFLLTLTDEYHVLVPIALHDGTRSLGRIGTGPLALSGGALPAKVSQVFFPHFETYLKISKDHAVEMASPLQKPLLVVGMTAQDLACLTFTDKFFTAGFRDDLYAEKRQHSIVVGLSGRCGKNDGFSRVAGGLCDIELILDGEAIIVETYTQSGRELCARMVCDRESDAYPALLEESDALPRDEEMLLQRASKLIREQRVPDEFWADIADRCIECTSCNYVCPTCTCFEVYDRERDSGAERSRLWDSCLLDGFMREASGHNPMGTRSTRTRRRIHHKLAADVTRWGHITCFACGRCDEACPTGIGIVAVAREIVERYEHGQGRIGEGSE